MARNNFYGTRENLELSLIVFTWTEETCMHYTVGPIEDEYFKGCGFSLRKHKGKEQNIWNLYFSQPPNSRGEGTALSTYIPIYCILESVYSLS